MRAFPLTGVPPGALGPRQTQSLGPSLAHTVWDSDVCVCVCVCVCVVCVCVCVSVCVCDGPWTMEDGPWSMEDGRWT